MVQLSSMSLLLTYFSIPYQFTSLCVISAWICHSQKKTRWKVIIKPKRKGTSKLSALREQQLYEKVTLEAWFVGFWWANFSLYFLYVPEKRIIKMKNMSSARGPWLIFSIHWESNDTTITLTQGCTKRVMNLSK